MPGHENIGKCAHGIMSFIVPNKVLSFCETNSKERK